MHMMRNMFILSKAHCKEGKLHEIHLNKNILSVLRIEDDHLDCPFIALRTDTYVIHFRLIR